MFTDPLSELDARFMDAMGRAFGTDLPSDAGTAIAPARNPQFGDFQANAAMALGKRLGRPPREVAQAIIDALKVDDLVEPPEIAGPGFINLRLRSGALHSALASLDGPALGIDTPNRVETVIVDLCGVNLAKEMHVGHIRATVIGDCLARLYERLGHTVKRQNHFGDWGLPIGMVTHAVRRLSERGQVRIADLSLSDLERIYREAQLACAADHKGLAAVRRFGLGPKAEAELEAQVSGAEAAMSEAKAALVALQSGDEGYVSVWRQIADITLRACFDNCRRLQVNVTEAHTAGESTYREELAEVVRDLESRGVAEESDGALVVRLDEYGIKEPLLLRKSDGGFLYATTDVAAVRRRVQVLGGDRLVYAVDARQSLHFSQVFAASRKAGYTRHPDGREAELFHAHFGTILGSDNKPFKTRSGDNVKLRDLLDEAVRRADAAVAEKNPDLSAEERRQVAEAVGIGAIKYADLSSDRIKDYVFDW
ncbi:MAG: arginine--tRNA ligase, partial [Phycisphaerales bacterium]|nr:arginine--tRNA ligase [Phycisphaerales bacterium]